MFADTYVSCMVDCQIVDFCVQFPESHPQGEMCFTNSIIMELVFHTKAVTKVTSHQSSQPCKQVPLATKEKYVVDDI